jgi:hypothetical protein
MEASVFHENNIPEINISETHAFGAGSRPGTQPTGVNSTDPAKVAKIH